MEVVEKGDVMMEPSRFDSRGSLSYRGLDRIG